MALLNGYSVINFFKIAIIPYKEYYDVKQR